MKRLIKSELYKAITYIEEHIEIYINPTEKEFNNILKDSPFNNTIDLRGMLLRDGTLYIWDSEIPHNGMIGMGGIPNGIHLTISKKLLIIYLISEVDLLYFKEAFVNTTSLYNFIGKEVSVYINCNIYNAKKYDVYGKINTVNDIINIEDEENLKTAKRLIKSDFYDSRDPGSDFIEVFKNPNNVEVDKVRNSNAYKSLNGLITPTNDIFIWRGDLLPEQLNIGTINVNSGLLFSFFPDWIFNANAQYDFLMVYNMLQMRKALLTVIGDMTKTITITGTTDTDHVGDFNFDNWTSMDDYYTANYTEVIE